MTPQDVNLANIQAAYQAIGFKPRAGIYCLPNAKLCCPLMALYMANHGDYRPSGEEDETLLTKDGLTMEFVENFINGFDHDTLEQASSLHNYNEDVAELGNSIRQAILGKK